MSFNPNVHINGYDSCFLSFPNLTRSLDRFDLAVVPLRLTRQARGIDGDVTFVVAGVPQAEFMRSTTNIVGVKVLSARVRLSLIRVHIFLFFPQKLAIREAGPLAHDPRVPAPPLHAAALLVMMKRGCWHVLLVSNPVPLCSTQISVG